MRTLLIWLSLTISCFGQVGGGFGLPGLCNHAFGPRPQTIWFDAKQFFYAGTATGTTITSVNDYSGHGNLLTPIIWPSGTASTNFIYTSAIGPAITVSYNGNNCYLRSLQTGKPSLVTSNAVTIAFQIYHHSGSLMDVFALDGTGIGAGLSLFYTGTVFYFDWPTGSANNRISVNAPVGYVDAVHTIICTHGYDGVYTNQSIWYDGSNIRSTNNVVGIQGAIADARFMGGMSTAAGKYYIKRMMIWNYVLPTNEIAHLGYWLLTQP